MRAAVNPKVEKKLSFSKIIFLIITILTIGISVFSCIAMWHFENIDGLGYLIPAVFTECAVVSGFYSYKAKAENEIKLSIQKQLIASILGEEEEDDNDSELE